MPTVSTRNGILPRFTSAMRGQGLSGTAARALAARLLGPASSFLLALLLARSLGAEGTGVFYAALTAMTALATLAKFGLETALQRIVGAANERQDNATVLGIYQQALWISGLLSILAGTSISLLADSLSQLLLQTSQHASVVRVLGLAIIPFSLLGVHAAMLKALGRPVWGGFFEAAAWPLFTLALVVSAWVSTPLTPVGIGYGHLAGMMIALFVSHAVLRRQLPSSAHITPLPHRHLLSSCVPLTIVELTNFALLWTPFLLIPALADASEAGLYNISHRLSAQLGLLILVFASIAAPRFAAYHQADDRDALSSLAGASTRNMLMFGMPVALVLLIWPEWLLNLFGTEFTAAADALRILVAAQAFNLATGPVGYLLAMTGMENVLRNIVLATLALTLPLSLWLIPAHGAIGAALAVALPMVFLNLACNALAARRLEIPFFLLFAR